MQHALRIRGAMILSGNFSCVSSVSSVEIVLKQGYIISLDIPSGPG